VCILAILGHAYSGPWPKPPQGIGRFAPPALCCHQCCADLGVPAASQLAPSPVTSRPRPIADLRNQITCPDCGVTDTFSLPVQLPEMIWLAKRVGSKF